MTLPSYRIELRFVSCIWRLNNSHVTTASWWTWEPRGTSIDYFISFCYYNVVSSRSNLKYTILYLGCSIPTSQYIPVWLSRICVCEAKSNLLLKVQEYDSLNSRRSPLDTALSKPLRDRLLMSTRSTKCSAQIQKEVD
jgi:hypothetical protein